jgi:hypothetical protein
MGALSLYKIVRYIMFLVMWTGEILLFSGSSTAQVRYLAAQSCKRTRSILFSGYQQVSCTIPPSLIP